MDGSRNFEEGESSRARKKSKRKSGNVAPSRIDQEEFSTDDAHYFRDPIARERFSLFTLKKIVPTKKFVGDFVELAKLFEARDWMQLIRFDWPTNKNYVWEFYANLSLVDNEDEILSSYIRGVEIIISPDIISQVLHIPREASWDDEYIRNNFSDIASILCGRNFHWDGASVMLKQGDLSIIARLVHFFVGVYVHPVCHTGNVTLERALTIVNILLGEPLDLAWVIFTNLRQFCLHPSGSLGYGFLITVLANYFNVHEEETDKIVASMTIDDNTISKSQGQRANVDQEHEEEENDEMNVPRRVPQYGNYTPFPPAPEDLPQYFHRTYDIFSNFGSEIQRGLFELQQEQAVLRQDQLEMRQEQMMSRQSQIVMAESLARLEDQMRNMRHDGSSYKDNTQGGDTNFGGDG